MKKRPMRERTFANSNVLASWAVTEAIRKAKANKKGSAWLEGPYPIRKVEAALFMLGAELPPIEYFLLLSQIKVKPDEFFLVRFVLEGLMD